MILGLLVVACTFFSCEERQDFPQPLAVSVPPKPYNLVVTSVEPAPGEIVWEYDLTWEVADPTAVKIYRIYIVGNSGLKEMAGTSEELQVALLWVGSLEGTVFGVSAVSVENVESDLATAVAP